MLDFFALKAVSKVFAHKGKPNSKAVDQVSFSLSRGEIFALIGESGSGKSTLGKMISGLVKPSAGEIIWQGRRLTTCSKKEWKEVRSKMQIVFQDSYAALNERMTVDQIIQEPLRIYQRQKSTVELLKLVGLSTALQFRYPSELSGGQCRRVNLARALALEPEFLIADELTSGLDLTTQNEILTLLIQMQKQLHLTVLFISHDLDAVEQIADRVGIMKEGILVEQGLVERIFSQPQHDYTKALLENWQG